MLKVIDKVINKTKYKFEFIDLGGGIGISYKKRKKIKIYNHYNYSNAFYLRLEVNDKPGVLSNITKELAKNKISIERLIQIPDKKNKKASIIIITHENIEKNFKNLLTHLTSNKFVLKKPTFIRIEII